MSEKMFMVASRRRIRFETSRGNLSTEDLWNLSLDELNEVAKNLNKRIKASSEENYLEETPAVNEVLELKFEIVLKVLKTKQAEITAHKDALAKSARKQKLLEILARKQDAGLEEMSVEDIQKEIAELA